MREVSALRERDCTTIVRHCWEIATERKRERERKSVSLSLTTVLCGIEEVGGLAYSQVRDVGSTWRMN